MNTPLDEKSYKLDFIKKISAQPTDFSFYQIAIALEYAIELLSEENEKTDTPH